MSPRRSLHDNTTRLVLLTEAVYERSVTECVSRWERRRHKRPPLLIAWLAHLPKSSVLLDLGCGSGRDAADLERRGYRVVGIDRTAALLAYARRRAAALSLIRADLRHLPVRPGTIDGIWAAASLMHLPKSAARQVLVACHRLVRPDGLLAATVTHGLRSRVVTTGWVPGRYFARWTKEEFARDVERAGWRIVTLEVVNNRERKGRWLNLVAKKEREGRG
jgi:SAM-dependent methyltransferase